MEQNLTQILINQLSSKSNTKQELFNSLQDLFGIIESCAREIIDDLSKNLGDNRLFDLEVDRVNDHEIHLKLAGDTIVFFMHTNIITLNREHNYNGTQYVNEDGLRKYLGQINIYNFMSDSIKFNRVHEFGYLIGRLLVNKERKFFIEGERMRYMYSQVSNEPISADIIKQIIQIILNIALSNDLIAPDVSKIRSIPLGELLKRGLNSGSGRKIGFNAE